MPKLTTKATKKSESAEDMRAFGPIFNKDLGQHILKNPLVAQGIVDKVRSTINTTLRKANQDL
jgi:18S rRNA (adenine1779-N6/adenine1780-N6)-dimethyltransferase